MMVFVMSSVEPMLTLMTRFPVKMNAKSIVVKVATTRQEMAFIKLLMGFSIWGLLRFDCEWSVRIICCGVIN